MSPEAQNRAIAESIGAKWHKPTEAEIASGSYYQYAPDYTSDLNAMAEVEATLAGRKGQGMKRKPLVVWVNVYRDKVGCFDHISLGHAYGTRGLALDHCLVEGGTPTKFIEAPKPKKRKPVVCPKCGAWGLHDCKPKRKRRKK